MRPGWVTAACERCGPREPRQEEPASLRPACCSETLPQSSSCNRERDEHSASNTRLLRSSSGCPDCTPQMLSAPQCFQICSWHHFRHQHSTERGGWLARHGHTRMHVRRVTAPRRTVQGRGCLDAIPLLPDPEACTARLRWRSEWQEALLLALAASRHTGVPGDWAMYPRSVGSRSR